MAGVDERGQYDTAITAMYNTVLDHKGDFSPAKRVHLFCMIHVNGDEKPIYKKNKPKSWGNKHAEELLITHLEEFMEEKCEAKLDLIVYINNSPCSEYDHNCAKKLRYFLNKYPDVSMKLYVTHLFQFESVSCEKEKCLHFLFRDKDQSYPNTCGLWNLMCVRCDVRPYDKTVWDTLLNNKHLNFSEEVKEELLNKYEACDGTSGRSRQKEDQFIADDLKATDIVILNRISEVIDPMKQIKPTWLVCSMSAGRKTLKLAKSDQGDKHAEELLLEELEKLGPKDETLTITIFMNDTPCSLAKHDCAGKFVQYLKTAKVDLTLYVTSLSKNREERCAHSKAVHEACKNQEEEPHEAGLKKLMTKCTVKCPSENAWKELFRIMNMCEKEETIQNFWKNYGTEIIHDTTRKNEDEHIRFYLEKVRGILK